MTAQSIKVVLADTNPAILKALRTVLAQDTRLEVVGSATEGAELLYKTKMLNPAVVLTDLVLPDINGEQLVRLVRAQNPGTAVLVVSPRAVKGDPLLEQAMSAGGFDFVLRPAKADEVERIGRLILTKIFVAATSTTKQSSRAPAAVTQQTLKFLLVEAAGNRLSSVRELVTAFQLKITPTVLVLVRTPPHKMDQLYKEVETKSRGPVSRPASGDFLVQGRVYLLSTGDVDFVVERRQDGWLALKSQDKSAAPGEDTPSAKVLVESLGAEFGGALTTVMLGVSSPASVEALVRTKALGGGTAIEEKSQALLDLVASTCADAGIPDRKPSLTDLVQLVNAPPPGAAKA